MDNKFECEDIDNGIIFAELLKNNINKFSNEITEKQAKNMENFFISLQKVKCYLDPKTIIEEPPKIKHKKPEKKLNRQSTVISSNHQPDLLGQNWTRLISFLKKSSLIESKIAEEKTCLIETFLQFHDSGVIGPSSQNNITGDGLIRKLIKYVGRGIANNSCEETIINAVKLLIKSIKMNKDVKEMMKIQEKLHNFL